MGGRFVNFQESVENAAGVRYREFQKIIDSAELRCPGNTFVRSCREQFERNRFLTDKQVAALKNVRRPGRRRYRDYSDGNHMNYAFDYGEFF